MSLRPLTHELRATAERELNEVTNRVSEDLEHIREWLSKQPHIKARMDAQWLIIFLRGSKFNMQRTKEKLDMFYAARTLIPQLFANRDPFRKEIQEILNQRFMVVLPEIPDSSEPRTLLLTGDTLNPDLHLIHDVWKTLLMTCEMYFVQEDTPIINGIQVIIDMKNTNYKYLTQLTPALAKKLSTCVQKAYPIRIKKFVFVNASPFAISVWNVFKVLLNKKLRERFVACSGNVDDDILLNDYSFSHLLKKFCGKDATWDQLASDLKQRVDNFRDWYLDDAEYGTDEKKRLGKTATFDELCGIEGTFRKLEFD